MTNLKNTSISIEVKKSFYRDFESIPKKDQLKIVKAIDSLKENPFAGERLKGDLQMFLRLKIGKYRLAYVVEEDKTIVVVVVKVGHRKDFYESLKRLLG